MLYYTPQGYLIISRHDDPHQIVDAMLETGYDEEFCVAADFSLEFITGLMEAGFLVMSIKASDPPYLLLPKLHVVRSVLFFENLHIKRSIKRHLGLYRLQYDADFDFIVDRCVEVHGSDWLTPPLVWAVKKIRKFTDGETHREAPGAINVRPVAFALYRGEKLVAGEFGIKVGRVYTSYSGYYDMDNGGTVQLILTAQYLRDNGFAFFDLGMPMDYKTDLGAVDIFPAEFVRRFRNAIQPEN